MRAAVAWALALLVALASAAPAVVCAAEVGQGRIEKAAAEPQNWLTYGGGYASQRYSALSQITPANVKTLQSQWVLQDNVVGVWQSNPLVVDGIMYVTQRPNEVVALDARTGKRLWHFQVVHHDIWDFDTESPPALMDIRRGGKTIPAVGVVSKSGYMFILDRVTGKPVYKVEEKPVPASDVPGEEASPTQPFPQKPAPIARTTMTRADLAQVTPELKAYCEGFVDKNNVNMGGPYLPTGAGRITVNFPGTLGGANWGGGTFDPRLGYYIVNTHDLAQVQQLAPDPTGPLAFKQGPGLGRFWQDATRLPCQAPPWGRLVAVDVNTGDIVWQSVLGVSDNLPEGKQKTGRPNIGGAISTAGGLVFVAATDDARFRAFDTKTGAELWTAKLPAAAHATPMTYRGKDGKQYVVIVSTGGSFLNSPIVSDAVTAYALP